MSANDLAALLDGLADLIAGRVAAKLGERADGPTWLDVGGAIARFGVDARTLRGAISSGVISSRLVGRKRLLRAVDVHEWIAAMPTAKSGAMPPKRASVAPSNDVGDGLDEDRRALERAGIMLGRRGGGARAKRR